MRRAATTLACLLVACGPDGIDDQAFDEVASAIVIVQLGLAVADDLVGLDGTLEWGPKEQNAAAVESAVRASLDGCGAVSRVGHELAIDLGTDGCLLPTAG